MILQVRGSSCSGKSQAVQQFMSWYPPIEELWETGWTKRTAKVSGYLLPGDLFVAGGYQPTTRTGGMDSFGSGRTAQTWAWLRWHIRRHRHVLFEGLMASLVIGRSRDLAADAAENHVAAGTVQFAFLDTPMNIVLARLLTRTNGDGPTTKGVNIGDTGKRSWNRVHLIRRTLMEGGYDCVDLSWRDPARGVFDLLVAGGWNPDDPRGVSPAAVSDWWYDKCFAEEVDENGEMPTKGKRTKRGPRNPQSASRTIQHAQPSMDDRLDRLFTT